MFVQDTSPSGISRVTIQTASISDLKSGSNLLRVPIKIGSPIESYETISMGHDGYSALGMIE